MTLILDRFNMPNEAQEIRDETGHVRQSPTSHLRFAEAQEKENNKRIQKAKKG